MMQRDLIPMHIIDQVHAFEKEVNINPQMLASAICASRWGTSWWDRLCFLDNHSSGVTERLHSTGLSAYDNGKRSVKNTEYYWLHVLSPLVAYGKRSKIWNMTLAGISLDPGINVRAIKRSIDPVFEHSFWYSVGGDFLQDCVTGVIDEDELRADVSGLVATEHYHHSPMTLGEFLEQCRAKSCAFHGDGYKESSYYQIAREYIKPVFGHVIIRTLMNYFPQLCSSGIIPIDKVTERKRSVPYDEKNRASYSTI